MQCYEYQMMLSHVYEAIVSMDKSFGYDEHILNDILCDTGVDNLQDLLKIDKREIWLCSLPSISDLGKAA